MCVCVWWLAEAAAAAAVMITESGQSGMPPSHPPAASSDDVYRATFTLPLTLAKHCLYKQAVGFCTFVNKRHEKCGAQKVIQFRYKSNDINLLCSRAF